jgi:hypothetical protein
MGRLKTPSDTRPTRRERLVGPHPHLNPGVLRLQAPAQASSSMHVRPRMTINPPNVPRLVVGGSPLTTRKPRHNRNRTSPCYSVLGSRGRDRRVAADSLHASAPPTTGEPGQRWAAQAVATAKPSPAPMPSSRCSGTSAPWIPALAPQARITTLRPSSNLLIRSSFVSVGGVCVAARAGPTSSRRLASALRPRRPPSFRAPSSAGARAVNTRSKASDRRRPC